MPTEPFTCDQDCNQKIILLESLIEELKVQNSSLITAVSELENEAYNRVKVMEELLERSAQATKAYMTKFTNYDEVVRGALTDKFKLLSNVKKLQEQCFHAEEERAYHEGHANNLMHDVTTLIKIVTHARNTGQWNVGNVEFCEVTFEQVFGSIDRLSHWSAEDSNLAENSLFESMSEAHSNDDVVCKRPSSINNAQVFQLQVELRQIKQILDSAQSQLSDRDRMIAELQTQITDLNHELSMKESDCFVHKQMIQKLQRNGSCFSISSQKSVNTDTVQISSPYELSTIPKLDHATQCSNSIESITVISCDKCREMAGTIEELRADNEKLRGEFNQLHLESCEELESALQTNLKLEQELSLMENLWQELETYKEDKENLLAKLSKKKQTIRDLEKKLLQQPVSAMPPGGGGVHCGIQTEICPSENELEKLRELEQRHQLKASGLEVVIQQLRAQMSEKDNAVNELETRIGQLQQACDVKAGEVRILQTKLENLENQIASMQNTQASEQMAGLMSELQITLKALSSRDAEIENQKQTILNLQDALVNAKRSSPMVNGQTNASTLNSVNTFSSNSNSKSREVFDI